jgi:hypothetical protein
VKRSNIKRTIKHKDPVTLGVAQSVLKRDNGCVGPRIGMLGRCGTQFGVSDRFNIELDHVNTSGLGKRGPSTPENLVSLCGLHHRVKTEQSRVWRARLNDYLDEFYEGEKQNP